MRENRRCERMPARLSVEVRSGGRRVQCFSRDVSRHGLYVVCDVPPAERQLLALRIALPNLPQPLDVVGSVAHRVGPDEALRSGIPTGMGIGFFVLSGEAKLRWDGYVEGLSGTAPARPQAAPATSRPTFLLRLRDLARLRDFEQKELSHGTLFIKTPVLRAVGETIQIIVIHPVTDDEFPVLASVQALSQGSPTEPKGMTLELARLEPNRVAAFQAFVAGEEEAVVAAMAPAEQAHTHGPPPPPPPDESDEGDGDPSQERTRVLPVPAGFGAMPPALPDEAPPRSVARPAALAEPPPVEEAPIAPEPPVETAASEPPTTPTPPRRAIDVSALREAVERDPSGVFARLRLAHALASGPDTAREAVELLRALLRDEPHHPLAHGTLALALAQLGERAEAERHLTRALRLGHVDPELERLVRS
ncbi:MAG: PilZ domain-containing protein [Deltaproteobacteria bacterium]